MQSGPCHAGLKGALPDDHPQKPRFAEDFAAALTFGYAADAGTTLLRLRCPGKGGIYLGGKAVYRLDNDLAGEVRST